MRVRTNPGSFLPPAFSVLASHFRMICEDHTSFVVPGIPQSLNHQLRVTRSGVGFLTPKVAEFRRAVLGAMGLAAYRWRPAGAVAAVIVIESPAWLTKERKIRDRDADNLVKPILDAIEKATGCRDSQNWCITVMKLVGPTEQTMVHLYDLGDVVDCRI